MKNFVAENLEELKEEWVTSDTGIELYADNYRRSQPQAEEEIDPSLLISDEQIESIIPPPSIRFNSRDFENYVDQLIQALDESPILAHKVFVKTLEKHPYLSRKAVGFRNENPFERSIRRFEEAIKRI